VASRFPHAAFPTPRDAAFIREPSASNRPMAFPYNKWHCAQMNVDQAAALLVCRVEAAMRLGVDLERVVFPLVALESSFSLPVPKRRNLHRWPAMEVLGRAAEAHLGHPLAALDHVELYSCFPAAVRVQQRALRLPVDGVPTITGGETFAGGPWNNFVLQATAAMIERLRAERDAKGLVTTLSGLVNKPGLAVYAARPDRQPLLLGDLADRAERRSGPGRGLHGHLPGRRARAVHDHRRHARRPAVHGRVRGCPARAAGDRRGADRDDRRRGRRAVRGVIHRSPVRQGVTDSSGRRSELRAGEVGRPGHAPCTRARIDGAARSRADAVRRRRAAP
jgi:hypothetical protein